MFANKKGCRFVLGNLRGVATREVCCRGGLCALRHPLLSRDVSPGFSLFHPFGNVPDPDAARRQG